MSTAKIVRKSFNSGEIAPELHFRSDLERYHNSCKSMLNTMVTPWGTATRRPPTELLHTFDTATYGVPVKYIPFRFSLEEVFHIVFTDGSGSTSPDSATCDFIVLDENGAIQILQGASADILSAPYAVADIDKLHHIQVNDFVYMTCGGLYPEYYISRFFDSGESANRWEIQANELSGGPFEDQNTEQSLTIFAKVQNYDATATYAENEIVCENGNQALISSASLYFVSSAFATKTYRVKLALSSSFSVLANDVVTIEGLFFSIVSGNWQWKGGTQINVNDRVEGAFKVSNVISSTVIVLDISIVLLGSGNLSFDIDGNANVFLGTIELGFYRSLVSSNLNNALTDVNFWEFLEFYEGQVNMSASDGIFASTDVGREVAIAIQGPSELSGNWNSDTISNVINAQGTMTLETSGGAWSGLLELQASYNSGGTWITLGSIRSVDGNYNGSIERTVTNIATLVRVKLTVTEWASPSGTFTIERCQWSLRFTEPVRSFFGIKTYIDSRNVIADTKSPLLRNIADYRWELGAFSETTGYPQTLTIHNERKVYGGTRANPNKVWASTLNDFNNFLSGDLETSPYEFTIKSDSYDTVRWLRSTRNLMIGTDNSESILGSRDSTQVVSGTNIDVQTQTYFGSSNVQAVVTADLIFFVQGQGERVRTTQYNFGTDQYLSDEISLLAKHILASGIKEMSYRRHPYSSIFFLLNNGKAVTFTYDRENLVKGWSRIEISNGEFISGAANYSDTGDIIGGIVKRGSVYTFETIGTNDADTVFLDSQVKFTDQDYSAGVSVPWSTATGLTVVRNDVELTEGTDYTISGGTLTIPAHTDGTVTVGYKFDWNIEPTDVVEYGDFGSTKRASKIALYLLKSGGCNIEINGDSSPFQEGQLLNPAERLSGRYELTVGGGYDYRIQIKLSGNDHKPFNLSAIGMYATGR